MFSCSNTPDTSAPSHQIQLHVSCLNQVWWSGKRCKTCRAENSEDHDWCGSGIFVSFFVLMTHFKRVMADVLLPGCRCWSLVHKAHRAWSKETWSWRWTSSRWLQRDTDEWWRCSKSVQWAQRQHSSYRDQEQVRLIIDVFFLVCALDSLMIN